MRVAPQLRNVGVEVLGVEALAGQP